MTFPSDEPDYVGLMWAARLDPVAAILDLLAVEAPLGAGVISRILKLPRPETLATLHQLRRDGIVDTWKRVSFPLWFLTASPPTGGEFVDDFPNKGGGLLDELQPPCWELEAARAFDIEQAALRAMLFAPGCRRRYRDRGEVTHAENTGRTWDTLHHRARYWRWRMVT